MIRAKINTQSLHISRICLYTNNHNMTILYNIAFIIKSISAIELVSSSGCCDLTKHGPLMFSVIKRYFVLINLKWLIYTQGRYRVSQSRVYREVLDSSFISVICVPESVGNILQDEMADLYRYPYRKGLVVMLVMNRIQRWRSAIN